MLAPVEPDVPADVPPVELVVAAEVVAADVLEPSSPALPEQVHAQPSSATVRSDLTPTMVAGLHALRLRREAAAGIRSRQ